MDRNPTPCILNPAFALALALAAGCIVSAPPQPKSWVVSAQRKATGELNVSKTARLGAISVAAPYDKPALAVKRADGSVAFDSYNVFATAPSALLRAPLTTLLEDGGRFGRILHTSSMARTGTTVEAVVNDISLDCSEEGRRVAKVSISLAVLENREVKEFLDGEGTADAESGDYSAAFSEALAKAVAAALAAGGGN
jgi:ABC-type uncharacterized transport system auxiliary subunit